MSSTAAAEHGPRRLRVRVRASGVAGPRRSRGASILLWIGVVLTILFCLFPFYWIINTSLKTGAELSGGRLFPAHPSLDNYSSIFRNGDFTTALRTSAIDAGAATLIALVIGSFAGYALARLRFPRKFLILAIMLSISTFPPIAIAAPVFKLWTDIGLYNTYLGLILPFLTFVLLDSRRHRDRATGAARRTEALERDRRRGGVRTMRQMHHRQHPTSNGLRKQRDSGVMSVQRYSIQGAT